MKRAGLTLIELVVGLTIASVALGAAYAGLATALDQRESATDAVAEDLEAVAIREAIRTWLEGARVPGESSTPLFSGADATYEGLDDDRLSFVTSASTPIGSSLANVSLYIDRDPRTVERGLVAVISHWLGARSQRIELIPGATSLEIRYRSNVLSGRPWYPSWASTTVMPAGVELVIQGHTPGAIHPILAYPIRVALVGGR
jgi:prepilin-type N-terminal cleavage/methylation domain-containing protein